MTRNPFLIDGCLSAGPCAECYRGRNVRVPVLKGVGCVECGTKAPEALTVTCCDATREQWEQNQACRTCRAVTAAKAAT